MAFLKYAKAQLQKPGIRFAEWDALRRNAISPAPDFQRRTAKVILQEYDPSKYMLSHATIVASVDVEPGPGKLGRQYENGFEVNRKYRDFYIKPTTTRYINNNFDSFERRLLLASFKTFVGAQSYVEHVQIPELSKGRIIDAAARDLGDTVYVDILIANELKHAALIRAIKTGQLGTLSMGCSTSSTTCSKCGNVAVDETELCGCVKFFKGSEFKDASGVTRRVAELCGHHTDPASVKFIEASWVANPAFKGAVLRNILTAQEVASVERKMEMALHLPVPEANANTMAKAAAFQLAQQQGQTEEQPAAEQGEGQQPAEQSQPDAYGAPTEAQGPQQQPAQPGEDDPISKAVKDLSDAIRDKAIEHVKEQINSGEAQKVREVVEPAKQNETLIKSALRLPQWRRIAKVVISFVGKSQAKRVLYGLLLQKQGGWSRVRRAGFSGREVLALSRVIDRMTKTSSTAGEARLYRTVLTVGGTAPYEDEETYLAACRQVLGRSVTGSEAGRLLEKGRLYSGRST